MVVLGVWIPGPSGSKGQCPEPPTWARSRVTSRGDKPVIVSFQLGRWNWGAPIPFSLFVVLLSLRPWISGPSLLPSLPSPSLSLSLYCIHRNPRRCLQLIIHIKLGPHALFHLPYPVRWSKTLNVGQRKWLVELPIKILPALHRRTLL